MDLCEPHRERGLVVRAEKTVSGTPMCNDCFEGRPISNLADQLFQMLLEMPRRRKASGIRTLSSAEQIRRRRERVRTIRPRTSWRRGKRELKLPASPKSPTFSISPRQSEILSLLTKGLGNKEIALALGLTERTVKFHVCNLYKKSATKNRTNLLLWYLERAGAMTPASPENSFAQINPGETEAWRQETSA